MASEDFWYILDQSDSEGLCSFKPVRQEGNTSVCYSLILCYQSAYFVTRNPQSQSLVQVEWFAAGLHENIYSTAWISLLGWKFLRLFLQRSVS